MNGCVWLQKVKNGGPTQYEAHKQMVGLWIRWLLNEIIICLIRNHFYVTESALHGNKVIIIDERHQVTQKNFFCSIQIFYFRKPLWKQIVNADLGKNDGVSRIRDMFTPLSDEQAKPLLRNSFNLPASQLRLLPKVFDCDFVFCFALFCFVLFLFLFLFLFCFVLFCFCFCFCFCFVLFCFVCCLLFVCFVVYLKNSIKKGNWNAFDWEFVSSSERHQIRLCEFFASSVF